MVNYWWSEARGAPSALDALLHAMLALRRLPPAQRLAWRTYFDHWLFAADETTAAHLPPQLLGVHGPWPAELEAEVRRLLAAKLQPDGSPQTAVRGYPPAGV
jgi:hypothetical protein